MTVAAAGLVVRWAKLYADHKAVSGGVLFVHLSGILLGGGLAVASDRDVLRAGSPNLASLGGLHRWVLLGLGITLVSGVGQFFSDVDTFLPSPVFWTKMGLIVLLLGNGWLRLRAERGLAQGTARAWQWLRGTAVASLVLWFSVLLAGTILSSVS